MPYNRLTREPRDALDMAVHGGSGGTHLWPVCQRRDRQLGVARGGRHAVGPPCAPARQRSARARGASAPAPAAAAGTLGYAVATFIGVAVHAACS